MNDEDACNGSLSLMIEGYAECMPPDIGARMTRAFDLMAHDGVTPFRACLDLCADPDASCDVIVVWTFPPDCFVVVRLGQGSKGYWEVYESMVADAMPDLGNLHGDYDGRRMSVILFDCVNFEYGPRELVLWLASLHKPRGAKEPNLITLARGRGKHDANPSTGSQSPDLSTNGRNKDHG